MQGKSLCYFKAESSIEKAFKRNPILEIRAHEEDMRQYLDGRILQFGQKLLETYREEIKTELAKAVDGT